MMNITLPYRVPDDLKMELLEFVKQDDLNFIEHGKKKFGRVINKYVKFDDIDSPLSTKVKKFGDQLFENMGMVTILTEPVVGYCLWITEEGGYMQPHVDDRHTITHYPHIRLNFLISKPITGGNPAINEVEYEIQEDECWFNHASIWSHSSSIVGGSKPRILLSLGKFVDSKEVSTFLKTFLYSEDTHEQTTIRLKN